MLHVSGVDYSGALDTYDRCCALLFLDQVLIESNCPDLLPEWMRFVKGVVDSEDLPLSISREKSQDTALLQR